MDLYLLAPTKVFVFVLDVYFLDSAINEICRKLLDKCRLVRRTTFLNL